MRKAIFTLLFTSTVAIAAPVPEAIIKSLKPWSPESVTLGAGTLQIITNQERVTDQIYAAILRDGVCMSLWLNKGSWSGVSMVKVLNRHQRQGYVFEGGEADCVELGKLSGQASDQFILFRTRMN